MVWPISFILKCLILAAVASAVIGCVGIPYPSHGGPASKLENELDGLIQASADRTAVEKKLGEPAIHRRDTFSYLACREPWGIILVFVGGIGGSGPVGDWECFEFILSFDEQGLLKTYRTKTISKSLQKNSNKRSWDVNEKELIELAHQNDMHAQYQLFANEHSDKLTWLCRSAEQGYYKAQWKLAFFYAHGLHGFRKDPVLAYYWYSRVEDAGHKTGFIEDLKEKLTPRQLAQVDRMKKEWKRGQCELDISELGGTN
jgi:hypothetical protein